MKPTEVIETLKWPSKRSTFTNSGCGKLAEVLIWSHFSAIRGMQHLQVSPTPISQAGLVVQYVIS